MGRVYPELVSRRMMFVARLSSIVADLPDLARATQHCTRHVEQRRSLVR
jgi:hypothetical protein